MQKTTSILKFLVIILILVAAGWFFSEYEISFGTNVEGSTNNPNQWEQPQDNVSKSDDGSGSVTFTAQYLPDQATNDQMSFDVFLNTHSVDLSSVDFARDIYIEKEGQKYTAVNVQTSGSGHHRSATMAFPQIETPFTFVGENISNIARRALTWDSL